MTRARARHGEDSQVVTSLGLLIGRPMGHVQRPVEPPLERPSGGQMRRVGRPKRGPTGRPSLTRKFTCIYSQILS